MELRQVLMKLVIFGTLNSAAAQMFEIPGRGQSLPLYGPVPRCVKIAVFSGKTIVHLCGYCLVFSLLPVGT